MTNNHFEPGAYSNLTEALTGYFPTPSMTGYIPTPSEARVEMRYGYPDIQLLRGVLEGYDTRVPNGPSKTGLDQLVWLKVKSSTMVEIRPTDGQD